MKHYLIPVIILYVCMYPFQGMGQPSWINDGLVAYYPFDGDLIDKSGGNRHGSSNDIHYGLDRFNNLDGCLEFKNFESAVIPTISSLSQNYTVSFWVYIANQRVSTDATVIISGHSGDDNPFPQNGGYIHVYTLQQLGDNITVEYSNNDQHDLKIPVGEWYHHTIVNYHNSHREHFINGKLVDSNDTFHSKDLTNSGSPIPWFNLGWGPITVGRDSRSWVGQNTWSGKIDELRFFDKAIPSNQVNQLYEYELGNTSTEEQQTRYIYWSNENGNAISRAKTDGSEINTTFLKNTGVAKEIYVTDDYLYWTTWTGGTIGRATKDGRDITRNLIVTGGAPFGLHGDDTYLYWSNNLNNNIGRSLLDGTSVNSEFLTMSGTSNSGLFADRDYIYFANAITGNIGRVKKDKTGLDQQFITGGDNPRGIFVDKDYIYWADGGGANSIGRAKIDGSLVEHSFISGVTSGDVVSDSEFIYWTEENQNSIGRAKIDGTGVNRSFISGIQKPYGISIDTDESGFEKLWQLELPKYEKPPAISPNSNHLVVSSATANQLTRNQVHMIDLSTGFVNWIRTLDGAIRSVPIFEGNSSLIVQAMRQNMSPSGYLYKLSAGLGEVQWRSDGVGLPTGAGIYDGTIYQSNVGNHTGGANRIAFSRSSDGTILVNKSAPSQISEPPAISEDGNIVYYGGGSFNSNVIAVNSTDGETIWNFASDGERPNAPSIGINGEVFVGGHTRTFYAFNGVTGDVLWATTLPAGNSYVSIVNQNNTIVTSNASDSIYALDGFSGQLKWTLGNVGNVNYGLAFGNDGYLYAAGENRLLAIDATNGEIVHEYQHNNGAGLICLARDGTIVVQDSKLTAYRVNGLTGIQNSPWPIYSHDPERTSFAGTPLNTLTEPVNNVPVALSQNFSILEDQRLIVSLAGTDSDNDPLTFAVTNQPSNGVLEGQSPNLTYIPNANFNGTDTFTFVANDGQSTSDPATIGITVNPVNDSPLALSGNLITNEDTNLNVRLTGTDIDGDALQFKIISAPAKGSLIGLAPNLVYVPNPNYFGNDSIQFVASDGISDSQVASIQIQVNPVNDAPVSLGANLSTLEDVVLNSTFNATDVDGDILTFQVINTPQNGSITISENRFTYTPRSGFVGSDSFNFAASDGQQFSNTAEIAIEVLAVNKPPIALGLNLSVMAGEALSILMSGTDPDVGDALSFSIISNPLHGSLSGNPPSIIYTPKDGFIGFDNLSFTVSDGELISNPATISIEVIRLNSVPTAVDDSLSTLEDIELALTLKGQDADGDDLTYTITEPPQFGFLSGELPNMVYLPSLNFNGQDSFTYFVSDAESSSAEGTVTIEVVSVNDPPTVQDLSVNTKEKTAVSIQLKAVDVENDPIEFKINTSPVHGSLTGDLPNLTYTPQVGFVGIDTFSYSANDGKVDSSPKTVTISVVASNLAPEAIGANVSGKQNEPIKITLSGSDPDGDTLEFIIIQQPRHGQLSGSGRNLTYHPSDDYVGPDSVQFRVNDGSLSSTSATVFIEVISNRRFPTLVGDINTISFLSNATLLYLGETLTLSASSSINKDFTYSWYRNGKLMETTPFSIYEIRNVSFEDTGQYHVVAISGDTELVSPTLLIEVSKEDSVVSLPFDSSEEVKMILGQRISLNSPVTGDGYSYIWRKDSNIVVGKTGESLSFDSNSIAQEGDYYVEVWNGETQIIIHRVRLIFTTRISIVKISGNITIQLDSGTRTNGSDWRLESSTNLKQWRLINRYSVLGKLLVNLPISSESEFFRLVEE